jgi:hypothetical protein
MVIYAVEFIRCRLMVVFYNKWWIKDKELNNIAPS